MKILFVERDLHGVMILGKPTMMIYKNRVLTSFLAFFFAGICSAQEVINLYYYERPPYILEQGDGTVGGILGTRASDVFKAAGIPFIWQKPRPNANCRRSRTITNRPVLWVGTISATAQVMRTSRIRSIRITALLPSLPIRLAPTPTMGRFLG